MVVWDGGATDFSHLNGAGWGKRLTLWIICVWNVGRSPLNGVNDRGRGGVSRMRCCNFQPTAIEYKDIFSIFEWFRSVEVVIIDDE